MASVINDKNGRKRIEFNGVHGGRFGIRLGKAKLRDATVFKTRIEYLTSIRIQGASPDAETSKWLAGLPQKTLVKLGRAGLIGGAESIDLAIGAFCERYIAERTDAKERTVINFKRAAHFLTDFFGESKDMRKVTEAEAESFSRYLMRPKPKKPDDLAGAGLSLNTSRRICGRAKQFFNVAIVKPRLGDNPFAAVKCRVTENRSRDFFITRDMAAKVLAACPDAEWRLIFALSRFGGLRCPSEHLALKWEDVNWSENRFRVHSPKTEHHEGKAFRDVPIFPELRPFLEESAKLATGAKVIATERRSNVNLRKRLHSIIEAAGLKPWPKTFHNLRATRETELARQFPIHVVCKWMGNSALIAKKHYLQITDDDYAAAAGNFDANPTRKMSEDQKLSKKTEESNKSPSINSFPTIPQFSTESPAFSVNYRDKSIPPPESEPSKNDGK